MLRIVMIGTGFMAGVHAKAILSLGHRIALVVGHSLPAAKAFAQEYGIDEYSDSLSDEMLAAADCVHICTPPGSHADIIRRCLAHAVPVLCEKPLCFSAREADELQLLAEKTGIVTAVGFNFRFFPAVETLREKLSGNHIHMVRAHYEQEFQMLPGPWSWRFMDPYRALTEIGTHCFDLIEFISRQDITDAVAMPYTLHPQRMVDRNLQKAPVDGIGNRTVTNEDACAIAARLSGGGICSIFLSEVSPGKTNDLTLSFTTDENTFCWSAEHPASVLTGSRGEGVSCRTDAFSGGYPDTAKSLIAAFYKAISTGVRDERLADIRDGARIVRLIETMTMK